MWWRLASLVRRFAPRLDAAWALGLLILAGCSERNNSAPAAPDPNPQAVAAANEFPNAIATPSGLRYVINREGATDSPVAKSGDYVQVKYGGAKGPAAGGQERIYTIRLGESGSRQGLDEGIIGMRENERRTLIPLSDAGAGGPSAPPIQISVELVKVFPGLKITMDHPGSGDTAQRADAGRYAVLNYLGTVAGGPDDGKQFESTYDDHEPYILAIGNRQNKLPQGWSETITGMTPGEKRSVTLPPQMAFGERGIPGTVPPNATVKFQFELVRTDPGVTWTVDREGSGEAAANGDTLHMHYLGTLADGPNEGTKFDASRDHQPPDPLKLKLGAGSVIPGWEIGLVGMKAGEKRTLLIPSEWGYGAQGQGREIPPNAKLKFEVELVKLEKAKVPATQK